MIVVGICLSSFFFLDALERLGLVVADCAEETLLGVATS
jgi:hypothetical protein